MLQVEPFTTFGIGSLFAVAASRQLAHEARLTNPYFLTTMLFFSLFFVPAVCYLLVQHPGWETMFVFYPYLVDMDAPLRGYPVIPWAAGLIMVFLILLSLVSGGLGFVAAHGLIRRGKLKAAQALWMTAGLVTLGIVIFGWDGRGWERTLFAGNFHDWHQWHLTGGRNPYTLSDFFSSAIFFTLIAVFTWVIAPGVFIVWRWVRQGRACGRPTDGLSRIRDRPSVI